MYLCVHVSIPMCMFMWAYMCTCTCTCTWVYMCRSQGSKSKSLFLSPSTLLFETVCHWSWSSLVSYAGYLAGPQDLFVSDLYLQHWGYRCVPYTQHLTGCWGSESRSSCLCSKCFVRWVIAPALTSTFLLYTSHWRWFTLDLSQRAEKRETENILNVPLCWKRSFRSTGVWWQCLDAQVCFINSYFASFKT